MALDFSPLHVEPSHYRALCLEQVGRYYWQNTEDYFWSKIIVELPEEPDRFTYGDELYTFPESAPPAQRNTSKQQQERPWAHRGCSAGWV